MPSRFSSEGTRDDAREVSENLGVDFREVPIEASSARSTQALGGLEGLAAENLQARIRGTMLMALSNTHGWLVLATGNKSEMAVGYATIYGDMVGGFALLKDVFKTDVFRLARHLNERAGRELIPVSTIERPPTAELRADQRDDQSLPPYEVLDPVLEAYVELDRSREELEAQFDPAVVERTLDARRPRRVQAPAGGTRREAPARGRSAATGERRSPIAGAAEAAVEPGATRLAVDAPRAALARRHRPPVPHRQGRRQPALGERLHQLRPALAVRHADVDLAPDDRELVGEVAGQVAELEIAELDRLCEEADDDLRRDRRPDMGWPPRRARAPRPVRMTTCDVVPRRVRDRGRERGAGSALPRCVKTTLPLWRYVSTSVCPSDSTIERRAGIAIRLWGPMLIPRRRAATRMPQSDARP